MSLFADRTSTETLRAKGLRLHFSSRAYVLVEALRRLGLAVTECAQAQARTLQLKLLKIATLGRTRAHRMWIRYCCAYPCIHGKWFSPRPGRPCAAERSAN